jgi:hypothetical protein
MTGRNRTILILAAVLAVLAGAGFWLTSTPATPAVPTAAPTAVVWDYSSATVQGLMVQSVTSTIALQVVNGVWRITSPVQDAADAAQVGNEADQLKAPSVTTQIPVTATDLAPFGLDTPALTVTLVLSGSTAPQQRLLVGKANVDGSGYYVRPAGSQQVSLVSNTLIEPLKSWLTTPPIALPTPTPLVPTILPTNTTTSTTTLTGTTTTTGTTVPTVPAATNTTTTGSTPAPAGTASTAGTQPPVGGSPVSTPPDTGPGASPAPSGSGGGPAGSTPAVLTPTP